MNRKIEVLLHSVAEQVDQTTKILLPKGSERFNPAHGMLGMSVGGTIGGYLGLGLLSLNQTTESAINARLVSTVAWTLFEFGTVLGTVYGTSILDKLRDKLTDLL